MAAEEAGRQAQQLQNEAHRVTTAEERVKAAEELREGAANGKQTAGQSARRGKDGLGAYKKPELIELAASAGIPKRTTMTKSELVDALMRETRVRSTRRRMEAKS